MMKKLKELKESKKGFTLVELIVVLVILAILAALLIPALTGYINKAKQRTLVAETRACVMAAQTIADELLGGKGLGDKLEDTDVAVTQVQELAEVSGTVSAIKLDDLGTVIELTYTETTGKSKACEYKNGQYFIDNNPVAGKEKPTKTPTPSTTP